MMSWRRNVSSHRCFTNHTNNYIGCREGSKWKPCVFSCSASEAGGEEAAGGEQQGEGAKEEEGEVRWEGTGAKIALNDKSSINVKKTKAWTHVPRHLTSCGFFLFPTCRRRTRSSRTNGRRRRTWSSPTLPRLTTPTCQRTETTPSSASS